MTQRSKTWLALGLLLVGLQAIVAYALPRHGVLHVAGLSISCQYLKAAFGDLLQFSLVSFAAVVMLINGIRNRGPARVFWLLMSIGLGFWIADLGLWAYYEVIIRKDVPYLTIGDTFLFLHLVPMVAALGARPERRVGPVGRQRTWLDFSLLLTYWLYFYALMVMPYQYLRPDLATYNFNFDVVDKVGHWVLVIALLAAFLRSHGPWRRLYLLFTISSISYAIFSDLANLAVDQDLYYTGSAYDILLIATMCAFAYSALEGRWMPNDSYDHTLEASDLPKSGVQWTAVFGMVTTLSTPVIGIVLLTELPNMNPGVRDFRLLITLIAMGVLVVLVFLKQSLLQTDMVRTLTDVSDAYSDLKNVKNQLVQSEKLASMGRLLAGTAHEINNPLTAILGYSDLIATDTNADAQSRSMAEKIGHQARRTRMLVEDLLKFSQETPTQRSVNNVQVLLDNAIKLAGLDAASNVKVEATLRSDLPPIVVDAGQILQVFVHLIRNAADAMRDSEVRVLHISTRHGNRQVQVEFADSGPGLRDPSLVFDPFYTTKSPGKGVGLGLSACYGIVQKHGGQITAQNRPAGGAIFTVTLPAAEQTALQNA
ncbi:MAG TPA: ATP-binding protein [Candidatus Koribacter sp.]